MHDDVSARPPKESVELEPRSRMIWSAYVLPAARHREESSTHDTQRQRHAIAAGARQRHRLGHSYSATGPGAGFVSSLLIRHVISIAPLKITSAHVSSLPSVLHLVPVQPSRCWQAGRQASRQAGSVDTSTHAISCMHVAQASSSLHKTQLSSAQLRALQSPLSTTRSVTHLLTLLRHKGPLRNSIALTQRSTADMCSMPNPLSNKLPMMQQSAAAQPGLGSAPHSHSTRLLRSAIYVLIGNVLHHSTLLTHPLTRFPHGPSFREALVPVSTAAHAAGRPAAMLTCHPLHAERAQTHDMGMPSAHGHPTSCHRTRNRQQARRSHTICAMLRAHTHTDAAHPSLACHGAMGLGGPRERAMHMRLSCARRGSAGGRCAAASVAACVRVPGSARVYVCAVFPTWCSGGAARASTLVQGGVYSSME